MSEALPVYIGLAGYSLIVLSAGSERIYKLVGQVVWSQESHPLAVCVIVSRRPGMLDNVDCVVSCTPKLLLVYFLIEWHVEGKLVAGI